MAEDPDTLQKLVLRLQQLCQLEALLDEALAHAPPSFTIPTANGVLTPFADTQTSRVGSPCASSRLPADHLGSSSISAWLES